MENLAESLEPSVPKEEIAADAAQKEQTALEVPAEKVESVEGEEVPTEEKPRADKFVKIQALDEQKHKRRAAEAQLQQERQARAVLEDRFNQMLAAQQQQNLPDQNDPLAVHEHQLREQAQRQQQVEQYLTQQARQQQHYQQEQQIIGWAQSQAASFSQEAPDFADAYKLVASARASMHAATGASQQEVALRLRADEIAFYADAARNGRNPAEAIYEMAQSMGYKKPGAPVAQQKVEQLNKGMAAAKGLSNGTPSGKMTPAQIAAMSDEDFDAYRKSMGQKSIGDIF